MKINIYNSLTRKIEPFTPVKQSQKVGMYTCGPTIYDYPTIGNWRTYILSDIVFRTLQTLGYEVKHVMNLTDVGHLSGDNEGDANIGEDRMEKAKKRESKTAWEIADFYGRDFLASLKNLAIKKPIICKATDHIKEQIELIKKLEKNNLTYKISDGIYFDVQNFEKKGHKYGELSTLDQIKEGARIGINKERKDPRDFALWKFSPTNEKRDMEWNSPWGIGFPGWHIECSAMSIKYLGEQFDIHLGGEDLQSTHHPNEIAQSEGVTNKNPFVKYWIHGKFLLVDGGKMGKSLGNAYTLHDVIKRKINPLALRYFYLTAHYRKQLNFTWEALASANRSLNELYKYSEFANKANGKTPPTHITIEYWKDFLKNMANDFNTPKALATLIKSLDKAKKDNNHNDILFLIDNAEKLLGLDLLNPNMEFYKSKSQHISLNELQIPEEIKILISKREKAKIEKNWKMADDVREKITKMGYKIIDKEGKSEVYKN